MKQYTTFVDEAGNTGINLTDFNQPFFVLAAVSVPNEKFQEAENIVKLHFEEVREKEETEIKATKWINAPKKQTSMTLLLQELQTRGVNLHIVALEKRFMALAKAVDTFFDYFTNGSTNCSYISNPQRRRSLTCHFEKNCTDKEYTLISEALRNPSHDNYLEAIATLKKYAPDEECIKILECSERNVDNIVDDETEENCDFSKSVFHSPNLTCFYSLANMLTCMCKEESSQTVIIFDDCNLCNTAFPHLFQMLGNSKTDIPFYGDTLYYWKGRILEVKKGMSQEVPLLQAADILATSIDKLCQKIRNGATKFGKYDFTILLQLGFLIEEKKVNIVASPNFVKKVLDFAKVAKSKEGVEKLLIK